LLLASISAVVPLNELFLKHPNVTQPLRDSYLAKLSASDWPVYDEDVNDTVTPYTRDDPPPAYYVITNQTAVNNSYKCSFNNQVSIQIDCITWQDGYSTSKVKAEELANWLGVNLFVDNQADFSDMLPDWNVWQGRIEMSRFLIEPLRSQTVVRKIIIISHQIQEL